MTAPVSPPRVSVVVPAYNAATTLAACLHSLVAQTLGDREILVMDDASTDATPEVAAAFAPQVTVVRQPVNRGQFPNVEDGIRRARGRYVAVYHADDVYDPTILAEEVAVLDADLTVGLVFALDRFIDGAGREYGRLHLPPTIRGRGRLDYQTVLNGVLTHKNVFLPTPSAVARTEWYRRAGAFRPEFGSAADLDMWLRMARFGQVVVLERHLFSYRHTSDSVGQAYQRLRVTPENYFELMDRHLADAPPAVVVPAARRAHEAHRAVDRLRIAVNAYIRGDRRVCRELHAQVDWRALLGSPHVPRPRHLVLWTLLAVLSRLPHLSVAARGLHWRFYRRLPWWHEAA